MTVRSAEFAAVGYLQLIYVKDGIYRTRASNVTQLRRLIPSVIEDMHAVILQNVLTDLNERLREIVRHTGGHIKILYVNNETMRVLVYDSKGVNGTGDN